MEKLWILWEYLKLRRSRRYRYSPEGLARLQQCYARPWRQRLARSPYYRSYQHKPLQEFPILNKALFMEHFDAINVAGITKKEAFAVALHAEQSRDFSPTIGNITVGLSSGTSGNKGIFLASPYERAQWVAAVLDRIIGWSWQHRKVAFFLRANSNLYESVKSRLLTFQFYDILQPMEAHVAGILAYQPDILVAQPSVIRELVQALKLQNRAWPVKRVLSVAEVLDPEEAREFQAFFGVRIEQVYQCTEGMLAHTCAAGSLHFNEDFIHIERRYLDETQTRFHPIITDYMRRTQPVIRYELNDIIHPGAPCSCGLASQTIARIEGRADDVFRLPDAKGALRTVYPDFIRRAVIGAHDDILDYRVTQTAANAVSFYIDVATGVEVSRVILNVQQALEALFTKLDLAEVSVNFTDTKHDQPGAKRIRVHNAHRTTL